MLIVFYKRRVPHSPVPQMQYKPTGHPQGSFTLFLWDLGMEARGTDENDAFATCYALSTLLFFVSDPGISSFLPAVMKR